MRDHIAPEAHNALHLIPGYIPNCPEPHAEMPVPRLQTERVGAMSGGLRVPRSHSMRTGHRMSGGPPGRPGAHSECSECAPMNMLPRATAGAVQRRSVQMDRAKVSLDDESAVDGASALDSRWRTSRAIRARSRELWRALLHRRPRTRRHKRLRSRRHCRPATGELDEDAVDHRPASP